MILSFVCSPEQFVARGVEEGVVCAAHNLDAVRRALNSDDRVFIEALAAPVERKHEIMAATLYAQLNLNIVVEHYRPDGEAMCSNGR